MMNNNSKYNKNQFLLNYRRDVTSQFGEDGIIDKIFNIISSDNNWCVEFGAWDGKRFSNTYNLIKNHNWTGVLIEGDKKRCDQIKKETHAKNDKVFVFNKFVSISGKYILDEILYKTAIPKDFDFLSIDIDGNDYHIWKSLKNYKPKVVVIEFNAFIPNDIEFVQPADMKVVQGHSILSLVKLAKEKGYELICINQENAFFVAKKYFELFRIKNNSINELRHYKHPLQIFQLYDGTLVFHGVQCLHYYNFPVDFNKRFQVIPKFIRDAHLPWEGKYRKKIVIKLIFKFYQFIYKNRKVSKNSVRSYCWSWKEKYLSKSK